MKRISAFLALALACGTLLAGPAVNKTRPDFGRLTQTNTVEYAPLWINLGNIVDGRAYPHPVWTSHGTTNQYAALGWIPVVTNPPIRPGLVPVRIVRWEQSDGAVRAVWAWDKAPPRNLSLNKQALKQGLRGLGVWTEAWAAVQADEDLLSDWQDSYVLHERDAVVVAILTAAKEAGAEEADLDEVVVEAEARP